MSTIAAISSPQGAGGIGIVRVSGKDALTIADAIFNIKTKSESAKADSVFTSHKFSSVANESKLEPLKMTFGTFQADGFKDCGYAVYFPAKQAFSGEDTVEFYLHGGVRIMRGALDAILAHGAVLADRGEFTKRAYLSGRMSLADAEGVISMINAESAAGLRAAYKLMDGEVSKKITMLSDRLLALISSLEATLDYPEEMEDEVLPTVPKELAEILEDVNKLLASSKNGRMAKSGITVVLAGETNSGKSSLMNAMLKSERAIVTPIAGTTRDTVTEAFEYDGVKINLVDTAGIRESDDIVEREGIARAKRALQSADVVLYVIDTLNRNPQSTILSDIYSLAKCLVFTVLNKCDQTSFACPRMAYTFAISAKTGENVESITKSIVELYKRGEVEGGELITEERHISALNQAKLSLESAIAAKDDTTDCVLIDIRAAFLALCEITGATATEDIINDIFSRFCIGK